jgi:hypothetical protein
MTGDFPSTTPVADGNIRLVIRTCLISLPVYQFRPPLRKSTAWRREVQDKGNWWQE